MSKSRDEETLNHLRSLANAPKYATDNPNWATIDVKNSRRLLLSCPLWIENTVTSGLKIELMGPQSTPPRRPHYGFKALLFASAADRTWHLGRIEFDPEAPLGPHHNNPPDAKNVPARVTGPHHHSFDDNVAYCGLDALSPKRDLPIAKPLDRDINNFNDILSVIRDAYIIPDLWLEEPRWSRTLL